jgi:hypothetical protein
MVKKHGEYAVNSIKLNDLSLYDRPHVVYWLYQPVGWQILDQRRPIMADKDIQEIIEKAKVHPAPLTIGGAAVAGAVIGSIIPGVGTAIGAGIGGLVGSIGVIIHEVSKSDEKD